jgi:ABC-type uncharacterized transport system involved in gliding motility auxiliary subunit
MVFNRKFLTGGALAVLAVLFVAVVLICNMLLRGARVDLTQNHLYTLSQGTKNVLANIDDPIRLYLFFSDKVTQDQPQLRTYAQRVREMIEEMTARAGGKLKLEVIDPLPFSEDEDRAATYGLQGIPAGPNGENVFFGLVGTNSTNGKATIPFLRPDKEASLEYDLTKLIHELSTNKKPVIGLMSGLPMAGNFDLATRSRSDPWAVEAGLRQLFDVRSLDIATVKAIDPDLSTLIVVHPKRLTEDAQYAIDQFVVRGGHLLVFVDPNAEADQAGAEPANPNAAFADKSSDLPKLFKAWGIQYDPHRVVIDRARAVEVEVDRSAPVRNAAVMSFTKRDLDGNDVITANLTTINVASAGFFRPAKDSKNTFVPLIQTSNEAMVISSDRIRVLLNPTQLLVGYLPSNERYVIAARLEGMFTSAFPDRKDPGHLAAAKAPGHIVLVADTDVLTNRMWVQDQSELGQKLMTAFANNGDFFFNAVDNLVGSEDLISIRSSATSLRPFTRVEDMKHAAEDTFRDKEKLLQTQLQDTERRLTSLQTEETQGSDAVLSPEQQKELSSFVAKRADIRKQLRQVRRGLDEQIDALGARIKFLVIGLVPLVVTIAALAFAWWKRRARVA